MPTASLPSEIGNVSFSSNPVLATSSETKIDEREEHADCEIQKPVSRGGAGGVIGIKGDGHCCFHLAGVIGLLCKDSNALSRGVALCTDRHLKQAREQILRIFSM